MDNAALTALSFTLSSSSMPRFRSITPALLCLPLLLMACSEQAKDTHPQQWVSKRQAVFKEMTKTLEPLGLMARERNPYNQAEFDAGLQALMDLSAKPWPLFTADGNYPPTRARASVWQTPEQFKQAQDEFHATLSNLQRMAPTANLPAIRAAVDAVEKSCKSCHEKFRMDRP